MRPLTDELIGWRVGADAAGCATMYLETATFMRDAHGLYRIRGFEVRQHYRSFPRRYADVTVSMQCNLDLGREH